MSFNRAKILEDIANVRYEDGFFVRLLQSPPHSRLAAVLMVVAMILAIGGADHWTGQGMFMIFFYLIPITLASAWFGARAGYVASFACSVTHSVADALVRPMDYTWVLLWNRIVVLAISLAAARCVAELMALHRHMQARVQARTRELEKALEEQTKLQGKIGEASRYERSALGRELHDGLCQHLAATNIAAGMLSRKLDAAHSDAVSDARVISGMLAEAIGETRRIARGVLLASIKPAELRGELLELCRRMSEKGGLECVCDFECGEAFAALDENQAAHLFFIAQEALRNAFKHAEASHIAMRVRVDAGVLELEVTDNGKGFLAGEELKEGARTGFGLEIMRHRAELAGAQLVINSVVGSSAEAATSSAAAAIRGTRICCRLSMSGVRAKGAAL